MGYFKKILIYVGLVAVLICGGSAVFSYVDRLHASLSPVSDVEVSTVVDGTLTHTVINALPYLFQNSTSKLRYHRIKFELPVTVDITDPNNELLALFSPQVLHGGNFYVNGALFFALPMSTPEVRHTWYAPMLAPIPKGLLHDNQPNIIEIEFSSFQRGFVVPNLMVGSMERTQSLHQIYQFISSTLANATNIFCWVVGFFMLILWRASKSTYLFGYAGGATILWATLFTLALLPELEISHWLIWRYLLYISTGGLVLLMSLFLFEYAQTELSKWLRRSLIFFSVGVPSTFLVWGQDVEFLLDFYWTAIVICIYVVAFINLIRQKVKQGDFDKLTLILLGHSAVATVFAYHDYGVQAGSLLMAREFWLGLGTPLVLLEPIFLTHFTLPLLLIIAGIILLQLHTHQLEVIENANETLSIQLLRRERELEQIHTEQKKIVSENAINKERNRILQDIHDGLGSRLINMLLETRTQSLNLKTLSLDIQACLEDLRLLVSGQFIDDAPFTDVLTEFCQRAARNLRTVGVALDYRIDPIDKEELDAQTALSLLRIIQEMTSNTIKHAQAQKSEIFLNRTNNQIFITIRDDGIGFDISAKNVPMKRGLLGINRRLKALNCAYDLKSGEDGTSLEISLNLDK